MGIFISKVISFIMTLLITLSGLPISFNFGKIREINSDYQEDIVSVEIPNQNEVEDLGENTISEQTPESILSNEVDLLSNLPETQIANENNITSSDIDANASVLSNEDFVITAEGVLTAYTGNEDDVIIPDGVITIGAYSFSGKSFIKSVTLPNSVETIEYFAFQNCYNYQVYTGLSEVNFGNGIKSIGQGAFFGCEAITSLDFPDSLEYIYGGYSNGYSGAFFNCKGLTDVSFGNGLVDIGQYAFQDCSKLKSISFSENSSLITIQSGAFQNCTSLTSLDLPESLITIGDSAFSNCSSLLTLELPATLENIYSSAFSGCSKLKVLEIPNSVKGIGGNCFSSTGLTDVFIGNGITIIPGGCFASCVNLKNVTLSEGLRTIGSNAFSNCSSIGTITIPDSVVLIDSYAFQNCYNSQIYTGLSTVNFGSGLEIISYGAFSGCHAITTLVIPDSVEYIYGGNNYYGNYGAFYNCKGLRSISFGRGLIDIGEYAFSDCSKLKTISFADNSSLQTIQNGAFQNCASLTSLDLPESLITIGDSAFSNCSSLLTLELPATLENIYSSAFSGCSKLKVLEIPNSVKGIGGNCFSSTGLTDVFIGNGITIIPGGCFASCVNLKNVTLSEGLRTIGSNAFSNCSLIGTITIPDSVVLIDSYAFQNCYNSQIYTGLSTVNFGSGLEIISYGAFSGCHAITTLVIPDSVEYIYGGNNYYGNYGAFYNCKGLRNISFGNGLIDIGEYAFSDCSKLKTVSFADNSSLLTIQSGAFQNCTSLLSLNLPESLVTIGTNAFSNCQSLVTLTLPTTLENIYSSAFSGCSKLSSLIIPDTVVGIGDNCFSSTGLTDVVIGNGIMIIPSGCFSDCTKLHNVTLSERLKTIGNSAFNGCRSLITVSIPDSVLKIENSAFQNCFDTEKNSGLTTIEFGTGLEGIGQAAFSGCQAIKYLDIPDSVEYIDGYYDYYNPWIGAFYNCSGLKSVTFGNGLTRIGGNAFYGCLSLTGATIPENVTSVETGAFAYCNNLTIYGVIDSTASTYASNNSVPFAAIGNAVESIDLNRGVAQIGLNETLNLTAVILPANATASTIIWTSSNPGVATVENGVVNPISIGTALITAITAQGSKVDTCFVTVSDLSIINISIETMPSKRTYLIGDVIDLTGLTVRANYGNGTSEIVNGYTIQGFSSGQVGEKVITIAYQNKTATFNVNIVESYPLAKGDVNGDGLINAADSILIQKYDAGIISFNANQLFAGDVNNDGIVDAADAIKILRFDAGLITTFA